MTMTRKVYEETAEIIRNYSTDANRGDLVREFSRMFKADNSRFDGVRFANACQPVRNNKT